MKVYFLIAGFILSLLLSLIVLPNILFVSHKKHLFDEPNARKVHKTPVPRLGGLSFMPVIMFSMFTVLGIFISIYSRDALAPGVLCEILLLAAGMILLYLTGEVDDLVGLSYRYKFVVQIISACLIIASGSWIQSFAGLFGIYAVPAWIGMPVTVFVIVFITNSLNLIDGIDGLASGLTIISLITIFFLLLFAGGGTLMHPLLAVVTLGCVLPFWFYNVFGNEKHGNKLFMGDTGSLTLGYLLSFFVIYLGHNAEDPIAAEPMIIALSSLIVPMFDVVRVSMHRIRKGRNPFLPDRNHVHHKLIRAGMRKTRYVLITILFMDIFFIFLNMLLMRYINVTFIVVIDIAVWVMIQLVINYYIKKNHGGPSYVPMDQLPEGQQK